MKLGSSGARGVYFRPDPQGSQTRTQDGQRLRGEWWARFFCAHGCKHARKVGPKSVARAEYAKYKTKARVEGWCPTRERAAQRTREQRRITVQGLLDLVTTDYTVNGKRSLRTLLCAQHALLRHLDGKRLASELTPADVTAYRDGRLAEGAKPATINRELSCLRRGFTLARRDELVDRAPVVATLTEDNVRVGFFEEGAYRALLAASPPSLQPLYRFLYLTGWRTGEALLLEWRQVDFAAGVVRLEPGTTKNTDGRTFPFAALPELEAVLREQREGTRELERQTGRIIPWVFHRDGEPIQGFRRRAWKTALRRAGLPAGLIRHDFRRTAVRNLERAGVPRSVAMKLTGHKTEAVYRRYAIVAEADLAEGLAKLAAYRERAGAPSSPRVIPLRGERTATLTETEPHTALVGLR